jgi:hypothetical protein
MLQLSYYQSCQSLPTPGRPVERKHRYPALALVDVHTQGHILQQSKTRLTMVPTPRQRTSTIPRAGAGHGRKGLAAVGEAEE